MKNLPVLCLQARRCIAIVGRFIQDELGKVSNQQIETKSLNSLVSYVDKTAEEQLVAGLGALLPEATFLTEEETVETKAGDYQWIIDPLDGTTNFLHQLPFFAISVALQYKGETILGIVHEVVRKECFYAWKGGGSYVNNQLIQVNSNTVMQDAMIATGFPYYDYQHIEAYLKVLKKLMLETRGIRRYGSAALDLVYVAAGRFDVYFEYSLHPWDVAAGALIVEEAGGKVSDFKGGDNYIFGQEIIAGNPAIFEKILTEIKQNFV